MTRKAPRPSATLSFTVQRRSHCGKLFITVTTRNEKPFEVFIRFGKAGGCSSAMADGVARLVSYGLRSGLDPCDAVKALSGIACHHGPKTCLNEVSVAIKLVVRHLETGTDLNQLIVEEDSTGYTPS
ncbi:TSCPD domain-containing protein [Geomonas limicola]|uniref:ribonucleoside-diphosphate reductase n=1 Tax=Geomonas limicola TaxID=2740186 RepID=A0A6V8N2Y5_9BACT|nr:TSCPD domain-containing protein [Geomonas limicola]GFO66915.1 TSCPD domain-containing protein [Geomonas limicola]